MQDALSYCIRDRQVQKTSPKVSAIARILARHDVNFKEEVPTLPVAAKAKAASPAPASCPRRHPAFGDADQEGGGRRLEQPA